MKLSLLRVRSFVVGAASLAALAVLRGHLPALPDLPSSLSSPVTTALLQELAVAAAWLLSALVATLLFISSLRAVVGRRPRQVPRGVGAPMVPARDRSFPQSQLAARSAGSAFAPPFPLIPRGRMESNRVSQLPSPERMDEQAAPGIPTSSRHDVPRASIGLLGPLMISPSKRRRRGLRSQTQEFLAYLALHIEGATTDELVAALWPDVENGEAHQRLWRSVSEARSQLGDVILRAGDSYSLDRKAVAVDLDQFNGLLTQADAGGDREPLLGRALALVRGHPLAGTDYPWAAGDVRHLAARIVGLLEELGHYRLADGNPADALAAAEQALTLDAYNEAAHQLAMRAESKLGLRQAIVERYEGLRHELDTQFGLEPERETRLLYRRLLSQDARGVVPASTVT